MWEGGEVPAATCPRGSTGCRKRIRMHVACVAASAPFPVHSRGKISKVCSDARVKDGALCKHLLAVVAEWSWPKYTQKPPHCYKAPKQPTCVAPLVEPPPPKRQCMGLRGVPGAGANDEDPLADAGDAGAGGAADELAAELEEDDSGRVTTVRPGFGL